MARNVNMGAHPYNDMKIGVPERAKIGNGNLENHTISFCGGANNIRGKLGKEYSRLKGKQKAQYLRSVYYKV